MENYKGKGCLIYTAVAVFIAIFTVICLIVQ